MQRLSCGICVGVTVQGWIIAASFSLAGFVKADVMCQSLGERMNLKKVHRWSRRFHVYFF